MDEKILISNAKVINDDALRAADILLCGGRIARIAPHLDADNDCLRFDAGGRLLTYGLCDLHVHFREPGQEQKETIASGSRAAARGGYTTVCTMPNLSPAPDAPDTLSVECQRIADSAVIDVLPYATLTLGRKGQQPVDMSALKSHAIAFSDDGSGIQSEDVMRDLMRQAAKEDVIIAAHCEDNSLLHGGYIHDGNYARQHGHRGICSESEWGQISRDLRLALETGCRYHVCHISTTESVEVIRKYKALGARVTCETAPHYLALCDDDLQEDGRFKMNPPLRSATDRAALIRGIQDGTIDVIATDHAPHTPEEKCRGLEKSPFGIVGLETAFPVLYTKLVQTGVITLSRLMELLCEKPREIFRISGSLSEGASADVALFDIDTEYVINSADFFSKGKATPFDGWKVQGKCLLTLRQGKVAYYDNALKNHPICQHLA
ncbi:MAG: dihydroorotase [Bacteroidales bacterium]|nr:dihydroorotase [Bacteroidales bacterium]